MLATWIKNKMPYQAYKTFTNHKFKKIVPMINIIIKNCSSLPKSSLKYFVTIFKINLYTWKNINVKLFIDDYLHVIWIESLQIIMSIHSYGPI